jgi:hypothetical protein
MEHYLHFHNNLLTCTCVLTLRRDKDFLFCHAMPSELVPRFLCPPISGRDLFLPAGTFMFITTVLGVDARERLAKFNKLRGTQQF